MDFSLTPEQKDIKKAAREFAEGEFDQDLALKLEAAHEFPREIYKKAGELGLLGMDYPEEIGGAGLGSLENVLVVEELCKADSGLGMALHVAVVPAKVLKLFGSKKQHEKHLSRVASGDALAGIALTEPDHGSDITSMNTTVEVKGDRFVINGTKTFISNANEAEFFTVLCQDDKEAGRGKGMTTVLVERDPSTWLGGEMEINDLPGKMGIKMTSSGELVFRDLEVPLENLVGERNQGLSNILGFFAESRVEIAAEGLGNAEGAFLAALDHAKKREQFGRPIMDFQGIGHKLGRMWSELQSVKYVLYYAAWLVDQRAKRAEGDIPLMTSVAKHHVPVTAKRVIDEAMTIFGGYGYFAEQGVERRYRDNRIVECYEGTVEMQLNNIVRVLKKMNPDYLRDSLI